jgi:hypothetical protein
MSEWTVLLLFVAWLLYGALRPVRDYYVLQRLYFDRLYEHPWRGKLSDAHYHGFDDYLAAKAVFDLNEVRFIGGLDDSVQEAEHSLFMVPARSKSAATARLKAGKAYNKALLDQTLYGNILKRREYWQKAAKEAAAYTAEQHEQ